VLARSFTCLLLVCSKNRELEKTTGSRNFSSADQETKNLEAFVMSVDVKPDVGLTDRID